MSLEEYNILKANIMLHDYNRRFIKFGKAEMAMSVSAADSIAVKPMLQELYDKHLKDLPLPNFRADFLTYSPEYALYLLLKRDKAKTFGDSVSRRQDLLSWAKLFPAALRDRVLVEYILNKGKKIDSTFYTHAKHTITAPAYIELLTAIERNQTIGNAAYNFTLEDEQGKLVRLSDFKGKVVFLDFWFTGCFGCNYYYEHTLSKVEEHYKGNSEIVFLSICIDRDKKTWLSSVQQNRYTGPHSINLYTQGRGSDNDLIQYYNISSYPTLIIIDKEMKNNNINNGIRKLSVPELISHLDNLIQKKKG